MSEVMENPLRTASSTSKEELRESKNDRQSSSSTPDLTHIISNSENDPENSYLKNTNEVLNNAKEVTVFPNNGQHDVFPDERLSGATYKSNPGSPSSVFRDQEADDNYLELFNDIIKSPTEVGENEFFDHNRLQKRGCSFYTTDTESGDNVNDRTADDIESLSAGNLNVKDDPPESGYALSSFTTGAPEFLRNASIWSELTFLKDSTYNTRAFELEMKQRQAELQKRKVDAEKWLATLQQRKIEFNEKRRKLNESRIRRMEAKYGCNVDIDFKK